MSRFRVAGGLDVSHMGCQPITISTQSVGFPSDISIQNKSMPAEGVL
jgi:hypothetical protein